MYYIHRGFTSSPAFSIFYVDIRFACILSDMAMATKTKLWKFMGSLPCMYQTLVQEALWWRHNPPQQPLRTPLLREIGVGWCQLMWSHTHKTTTTRTTEVLLLPQLKNISPTWPTCFLFYEFVRVCASLKVVVSEASWLGGRQDSKSVWFQNALKYGLLDDSPNRLGRPGQLSIELNSHIYCKARLTAYLVIHVISCHIYSIYISYIHLSIYPPINLSIYASTYSHRQNYGNEKRDARRK